MPETIGIIGLGSAGQRHARNALAMGLNIVGYDTRPITLELMAKFPKHIPTVKKLEYILDTKPRGIIVATPPQTHYSVATEIVSLGDFPCLVEKPLSTTAAFAKTIIDAFALRAPIAVGYQFHHVPALRKLKADVDAGKYGTIFSAHVELSTNKWCSGTYDADFLLEASHELDLLRWMLGNPVDCAVTYNGGCCHAIMGFGKLTNATVHLDGISPDYRRRLVLYGTKGTAFWHFDHEENEAAYALELEDFVRVCRGEKPPECTAEDGWWALRMVEAIKRSAGSGRWESC